MFNIFRKTKLKSETRGQKQNELRHAGIPDEGRGISASG